MTDDTPISYEAAARGTQLLSSADSQIGILEHVLQVPELDVFDGIVIATKAGLRLINPCGRSVRRRAGPAAARPPPGTAARRCALRWPGRSPARYAVPAGS